MEAVKQHTKELLSPPLGGERAYLWYASFCVEQKWPFRLLLDKEIILKTQWHVKNDSSQVTRICWRVQSELIGAIFYFGVSNICLFIS